MVKDQDNPGFFLAVPQKRMAKNFYYSGTEVTVRQTSKHIQILLALLQRGSLFEDKAGSIKLLINQTLGVSILFTGYSWVYIFIHWKINKFCLVHHKLTKFQEDSCYFVSFAFINLDVSKKNGDIRK